jgi:hypothetical protein
MNELPRRYRPRVSRVIAYLLVSLCFAAAALFLDGAIRWATLIFGGIGAIVFATQLAPNSAYLELRDDGFTFASLWRAHTVRWSEVSQFGIARVGLRTRLVGWNYVAPASRGQLSRSLSGYEAALPDTYGMSPEELCALLDELRRTSANSNVPPPTVHTL